MLDILTKNPSRTRILLTRLAVIPVILIHLLTGHSWSSDSFLNELLEVLGISLIFVGIVGRIWSSLYICGRKTSELITIGPYSVVRNPLYVSSFIGAFGVGLVSENLFTLLSITGLFLLYYRLVIQNEETKLRNVHGASFDDYFSRVPSVIPKLSLYCSPKVYEIDTERVRRVMFDAFGFIAAFVLVESLEFLRHAFDIQQLIVFP